MNTDVQSCARAGDQRETQGAELCPVSRRKFLGAMGVGVAAPAVCLMGKAQAQSAAFVIREDRFGRIFPRLPAFAATSPELAAALTDIGKPEGVMDAKDPLERGPIELITDPALSVNNPDNTIIPRARRSWVSSSTTT